MSPSKTQLATRLRRELRRARARKDTSDTPGGELNIVPFLDVVVNLMLFLLATSSAALALAQHDSELGGLCRGPHCGGREPGLGLSVTLTERGAVVATREGFVAAGCEGVAPGFDVAVARAGGRYDVEGLARCLERIHRAHPAERDVILSAEPRVAYEDLVGAMDASRPSFPRIQLSAGVR